MPVPGVPAQPTSRFSGPCLLIYWPLTGPGMSSILAAPPLLDIHVSHSGRFCINFGGPRGALSTSDRIQLKRITGGLYVGRYKATDRVKALSAVTSRTVFLVFGAPVASHDFQEANSSSRQDVEKSVLRQDAESRCERCELAERSETARNTARSRREGPRPGGCNPPRSNRTNEYF